MRYICINMQFSLINSNDIKACNIPRSAYTNESLLKKDYVVGIYERLKDDYKFEVNESFVDLIFEDIDCFDMMKMFKNAFKDLNVALNACTDFEDSVCKNGELIWEEFTSKPFSKENYPDYLIKEFLIEERSKGEIHEEV